MKVPAAKPGASAQELLAQAFAWLKRHEGKYGAVIAAARHAGLHVEAFRVRYRSGNVDKSSRGPAPRLGTEVEMKLREHILACADVACCLTPDAVQKLAKELAKKLRIPQESVGGRAWREGFMYRHPMLTVRMPQLLESYRATAVSTPNMARYFEVLWNAVKDVLPTNIYNYDEAAVSLRNLREAVIARKGARQVNVLFEGENAHVTFGSCISAGGRSIAPLLIFSGERPLTKLFAGFPEAVVAMQPNGFITNDIWVAWLDHFIKESGGNCTLIVDYHVSRSDLRGLLKLREANVKLVVLHPHTTHVCQPCDVAAFRAFKHYLRGLVSARRSAGTKTLLVHIAGLIKQAWAMTIKVKYDPDTGLASNVATSGFAACGIFPFDPSKISGDKVRIADGLLARARAARELEEAQEDHEDLGGAAEVPAPEPKTGTKRKAPSPPAEAPLEGAEALAAVEDVLRPVVPIALRLADKVKSKAKTAALLTGDAHIEAELAKEAAKDAEAAALAERKKVREAAARARDEAAAAAQPKQKRAKKEKQPKAAAVVLPSLVAMAAAAFAAPPLAPAPAPALALVLGAAGPQIALALGGGVDFAAAMAGAAVRS